MFQKIKQSVTPTRGGKKKSSSSNNATTAKEEDESTSLLASSSAPPPPPSSITSPLTAAAMQHRDAFQQQQQQLQQQQQGTLMSIEELERGAKRLISDNIGDSDSVNNLLQDEEDSISSYSIHGSGGAGAGGLTNNNGETLVTEDDVNFLTSSTSQQQQQRQQQPSSGLQRRRQRPSSTSSKRRVDEIGNQLLQADGNARLEHDILRKSLNLIDLGPTATLLQQFEEDEEGGDIKDEELVEHERVLERIHESTRRLRAASIGDGGGSGNQHPEIEKEESSSLLDYEQQRTRIVRQVLTMVGVTAILILLVCVALALGTIAVGPPKQPVGAYKIIEAQVGHDFWQYYDFYAGKDSAGSNGHIMYVSEQKAREEGIVNVVTETVGVGDMIEIYEDGDPRAEENWLAEDLAFLEQLKRKKLEEEEALEREKQEEEKKQKKHDEKKKTDNDDSTEQTKEDSATKEKKANRLLEEVERQQEQEQAQQQLVSSESIVTSDEIKPPRLEPFNPDQNSDVPEETFVVISSTPTPEGPRNSVRLEGRRRFNRGLFIIDLRHMPAGCGTWPAFWLTDEANWPVNGEIDIVEGVNYQDTAKTALHTTRVCRMDDVPEGSKTGTWDTAVGIPDRKTGIPDMTFRYAQDCFVYDPHQWINQGCVASDLKLEGRSLGVPLNQNGGGVYALEWDPVYKHIKTWVFSPHGRVPSNLRDALRTATNEDESTRVAPDTNQWGLPYGHFPIGDGTNCPAGHFRNMRLVINLAFCGSVAGNRYFMDCPKQFKKFKTCNEWVESDPDELKEAYWKIRGVYVYEREWQKQWS
mmetsp:Transcript_22875/g.37329  ORF Transcript_22875/g.37329 Transcript_22875/m.37329 type:complete len:810 (-) Transcript_22875:1348-3777(-)